jgi:hypothetical protein
MIKTGIYLEFGIIGITLLQFQTYTTNSSFQTELTKRA